jgi:uncharacterized membrane protein YqgA involved in biofilm formation
LLAVILNGLATTVGALIGSILKKGLDKKKQKALFSAIALCVAIMGIQSAVKTENLLLILISMAIGTVVGTAIGIEDGMHRLGQFLQNRFHSSDNRSFLEGFVTLSIMQVIGALAILGPIAAAFGDNSILYFKSVLDFTAAFIFGSIYGLGAVPVGIVVAVYEMVFFLLASAISPLMTPDVVREVNAVGGIMILAIALNMLEIAHLKAADYLPALFIPVLYYYLFF